MAKADLESSIGSRTKPVPASIRAAMSHQVGDADKGLATLAICGTESPAEYPANLT